MQAVTHHQDQQQPHGSEDAPPSCHTTRFDESLMSIPDALMEGGKIEGALVDITPDHRLTSYFSQGQRPGGKHNSHPEEASMNNGWSFFDNAHGSSCSMRPAHLGGASVTTTSVQGGASWGGAASWLAASPQTERSPSSVPLQHVRPPPPPRVDGAHITDPLVLRATLTLTPLPPPLMSPEAAAFDDSDDDWP